MGAERSLTAIVLAAGQSRRMGAQNKLLLDVGGRSVLARAVSAFVDANVTSIIVVTGADRGAVKRAVPATDRVRLVHNPEYTAGMGASIRCGVSAIHAAAVGYAICPGDLPLLTSATIRRLLRAFREQAPPCIVRPRVDGQPGHPVLFDAAFRDDLLGLKGDEGARDVLRRHVQRVTYVDVDAPGTARDVDTPQALRTVRTQVGTASSSDGGTNDI